MNEVKRLGNLYGEDRGTGFAGNVWDKDCIASSLTTMQGGMREPMIVEANSIRMVRTEEGKALRKQYENHEIEHGFNEHREPELRNDGCTNTLSTVQKDNYICVAMRGRNPTNQSDRTPGIELEQTLEANTNGTSNCLTSVQKDNLVLEKNIPCKLNKMPYGHLDSMENAKICDINTLTSSTVTARYYKGIGAHKDNMVMDKVAIKQNTKRGYIECNIGGVEDFSYPDSQTRRGCVQEDGETCPTFTAENQGICKIETQYRIRKLTPKECWRLMDFSDEDFEKAEKVNSNTQLYKQAGNSIVVNVLVAILGQLLQGKEDLYKEII